MSSKGISIHIGLNNVDPAAYNGWNGALAGCLNDVADMKAIAEQLGFTSTTLTDSDATADNVIAAIGKAASDLGSEDILLLTYSGHGGQVPDVNGDEDDDQDETWVLWNRQLVDDELYALWAQFESGARIVVLSDSCHSGTMARVIAAYAELPPAPRNGPDPVGALRTQLGALIPQRRPTLKVGMKAAPLRAPEPWRAKLMPSDVRAVVNTLKAKENAAHQYVAGPAERAEIGASVIVIGGCQDDQVSMDGAANGLFTEKLKVVWNEATFDGSYKDFVDAIVAEMPDKQRPNYYAVGSANAAFESQRPFTVTAPGKSTSTSTGSTTSASNPTTQPSEPTTDDTRPVLKRGDKGPYVKELQNYLLGWEFNVDIDSIFGPKTESAVRSFQSTHQLETSGVVDAPTWDALD